MEDLLGAMEQSDAVHQRCLKAHCTSQMWHKADTQGQQRKGGEGAPGDISVGDLPGAFGAPVAGPQNKKARTLCKAHLSGLVVPHASDLVQALDPQGVGPGISGTPSMSDLRKLGSQRMEGGR